MQLWDFEQLDKMIYNMIYIFILQNLPLTTDFIPYRLQNLVIKMSKYSSMLLVSLMLITLCDVSNGRPHRKHHHCPHVNILEFPEDPQQGG